MERDIKKWLGEICRGDGDDRFIDRIEVDDKEGEEKNYDSRFKCHFYTNDNKYTIIAIDRGGDNGYLGCTVSQRKSVAGEDWTRGNDLPDGPYNYETWQKIKNAIISYEIVEVSGRKITKIEKTNFTGKEDKVYKVYEAWITEDRVYVLNPLHWPDSLKLREDIISVPQIPTTDTMGFYRERIRR